MQLDLDMHNRRIMMLRLTKQDYTRSSPHRQHHRASFVKLECTPLTQQMCMVCSEKVIFIFRVHLKHDRLLEHASILRQRRAKLLNLSF